MSSSWRRKSPACSPSRIKHWCLVARTAGLDDGGLPYSVEGKPRKKTPLRKRISLFSNSLAVDFSPAGAPSNLSICLVSAHAPIMAVNEHRPTAAEFKFDMKEGGTESSATFIFG